MHNYHIGQNCVQQFIAGRWLPSIHVQSCMFLHLQQDLTYYESSFCFHSLVNLKGGKLVVFGSNLVCKYVWLKPSRFKKYLSFRRARRSSTTCDTTPHPLFLSVYRKHFGWLPELQAFTVLRGWLQLQKSVIYRSATISQHSWLRIFNLTIHTTVFLVQKHCPMLASDQYYLKYDTRIDFDSRGMLINSLWENDHLEGEKSQHFFLKKQEIRFGAQPNISSLSKTSSNIPPQYTWRLAINLFISYHIVRYLQMVYRNG